MGQDPARRERTVAKGLGLERRHVHLLIPLVHRAVGALHRGKHAVFGSRAADWYHAGEGC